MKRVNLIILALLMVFTTFTPYVANAQAQHDVHGLIDLKDLKIISSDDNGSVYRITSKDGTIYEYNEKVVSSKKEDTITTQIYTVDGDKKDLVEEFTTYIKEDGEVLKVSNSKNDNEVTLNIPQGDVQLKKEFDTSNLINAELGVWYGSYILSGYYDVKYKLISYANDHANVSHANYMKGTKISNGNFDTLRINVNDMRSHEASIAKAGLFGVVAELALLIKAGEIL